MDEMIAKPTAPPVYMWYKVYCIAMVVMFLFVVGAGLFFLLGGSFIAKNAEDRTTFMILGPIYIIMGLVLLAPFAVAPFLSPTPWVWIYGLVLICLGMTSSCCLPACIPLLIYWIKPDVKKYFGREN